MLPNRPLVLVMFRSLWLAACLLLLCYAWVNRAYPDTSEAVLWALLVLAFPVSAAVVGIGTLVVMLLYSWLGVNVPGGFGFSLVLWLICVGGAYWLWFVYVPDRRSARARASHSHNPD